MDDLKLEALKQELRAELASELGATRAELAAVKAWLQACGAFVGLLVPFVLFCLARTFKA